MFDRSSSALGGFIWNWPAGSFTPGTVEELVESVDVFLAICSLLGIATPHTVHGLDISPMLSEGAVNYL